MQRNGWRIVAITVALSNAGSAQNCWYPIDVQRASVTTGGQETQGACVSPGSCSGCKNNNHGTISANGSRVAFSSDALPLVPVAPTAPCVTQIYVRDLSSNFTVLVSTPSHSGTPQLGDGSSDFPDISRDGGTVVFESPATNLTSGVTNGFEHIYCHDLSSSTTTRISQVTDDIPFDSGSESARVSGNGAIVTFATSAANPSLSNTFGHGSDSIQAVGLAVLAIDRTTGAVDWISAPLSGAADGESKFAAINADGRFVAFTSFATNLLAGPSTNGEGQVYVRDRVSGALIPVSVGGSGEFGKKLSRRPAISDSGRYIAFESLATNLVASADSFTHLNIFVRDRDGDGDGVFDEPGESSTILVSVRANGRPANQPCGYPAISGNGRFVVFTCTADNFHPCDAGQGSMKLVMHDRDVDGDGIFDEPGQTFTAVASKTPLGIYPNAMTGGNCGISQDGRFAVFNSEADNLVAGDTGPVGPVGRDVFRVQLFP